MRRNHYHVRSTLVALASAALIACTEGSAPSEASSLHEIGVLQLVQSSSFPQAQLDNTLSATGAVTWDHPPVPGAITAPVVIEAPDTLQVGQQFDVIVRTVLPDGCWSTDGQVVAQSGLTVQITPRDAHSGAQVCTMMVGFGEHRVRASFATAGSAAILVHGRVLRRANQSFSYDEVNASRTVVVR